MNRNQPRTDQTIDAPHGRRIAVAEVGSPDGPVVVLLHRSPGSRLLDPDPAVTEAAGVRLVCVDRPGYGATDPVAAPSRALAADDLEAVVGALGLEDVALVGWSGGGQFAVEAAARPRVPRSVADAAGHAGAVRRGAVADPAGAGRAVRRRA